jgi:release factor H-coupled RctB family protein
MIKVVILIKIISTEKSWIEGVAVQQLEQINKLPGVLDVTGFPDLHSGPVGIAVSTADMLYPHLIGSDIGCGMCFCQTDAPVRKGNLDKMVQRLTDLDTPYEGITEQYFVSRGIAIRNASALGTIGAGNHFAELQKAVVICNEKLFSELELEKDAFTILVHSGSRELGRLILDRHIQKYGSGGLPVDSPGGSAYRKEHDYAVNWAHANRELIVTRFMEKLRIDGRIVADTVHNSITCEQFSTGARLVHRKGASPGNRGVTMVAGSRGSLSYLVKPIGDSEAVNFSLAHGAGRKLKRNEMRGRLSHKYTPESLTHTRFGGRVICEDKDLLYEEAPEAYKNIDQVISDMQHAGLIEVIAAYQPLITYKKREDSWS